VILEGEFLKMFGSADRGAASLRLFSTESRDQIEILQSLMDHFPNEENYPI